MKGYCKTKVSMVVPVYNKIDDIDMMLESVRNQVWDNIELILVNDGATDGTRERLSDWEPKLRERGYSVVIVDQENQGISAAVRNGMLRMTGDYFCSVDCDDYLYPEYVSTMASWLDEHPECDYTACGFERILGTKGKEIVITIDLEKNGPLSSPLLAERILLGQVDVVTWVYLVRTQYIAKCKVIENFVTEPRLHQEPSVSLPLAMGGGQIKYFRQTLLRHFLLDRKMDLYEWDERFPGYLEILTFVRRTVIAAFPMQDESRKKRLLHLCELAQIKLEYSLTKGFAGGEDDKVAVAKQLADFTNRCFELSPGISYTHITASGFYIFFNYLENRILGTQKPSDREVLESSVLNGGGVMCYGALGKMAQSILPALLNTKLKPDVLWDAAANGETVCGIDVTKPEFSALCKNDVFIILPKDPSVEKQIAPHLAKAQVKMIVSHYDIVQYLGEWYYSGCT